MLRILKRLRHGSEVSRLRQRAQKDTYPRSYVELCRALLNLGDPAAAMEEARRGLERFPHSEDLRDVLRHTWRQTKSSEVETLRERCKKSGAPATYRDLAGTYMDCEEFDEALAVAEEMGRHFPDEVSCYLLQAEILLKRFHKDHVAHDATRAVVHLKRAIEIDERSFQAHFLLTELYHYIGAVSKALFHLYKALDIDPGNESTRVLHEQLVRLPLEKDEESILLREIEENEDAAMRAPRRASDGEDPAAKAVRSGLVASIARLSQLNGVTRVAFASPDLSVVAQNGETRVIGPDEADPLCEIARRFRKAASVSAKRIGVGAFQTAVLYAGSRFLQFQSADLTVVLVESDDPARAEIIKAECANFVASSLRTAKEPVHA